MAPRVEDLLEDIKNILAAQASPAPAPGGGTSAQDAIDLAEEYEDDGYDDVIIRKELK